MLTSFSDKQEAKEWLKNNCIDKYDKRSSCILTTDCRLIDLVRDDAVDPIAAKLASKLAILIDYRNIAYTTTDEMAKQLGINKYNLSRAVKLIDNNGLVLSLANNGIKKTQRTLVFNPSIFWRGSYHVRAIWEKKVIVEGCDWRDMSRQPDFEPIRCEYEKMD